MKKRIDINCDMGEGFGPYQIGADEEIIKLITSANIACGFHAGDPQIMDSTIEMAKSYGVSVGAHPGYLDILNFGRKFICMEENELKNIIIYQIGALDAFCRKHEIELKHFKPHGALGNVADSDKQIARVVADTVKSVFPELRIFVKPNSEMHKLAEEKNLKYALEIYADRAYNDDLSLVSRTLPGAVISNPKIAAERVIKMILEGKVTSIQGNEIDIKGDTVCIHGDTPSALDMIKEIKQSLEVVGIEICSLS